MKNIRVSNLKIGDVFTDSLQLKNRESYRVSVIEDCEVFAIGNNSGKLKLFDVDQEKHVILLNSVNHLRLKIE